MRVAAALFVVGAAPVFSTSAQAGDAYATVPAAASGWQVRFTPFAWVPGVSSAAGIHGHKVDIDVSVFIDAFDSVARVSSSIPSPP